MPSTLTINDTVSTKDEVSLAERLDLTLRRQFPNISGAATQDSDHFDLYDYLGDSWGLILLHPADFTPVCTTELGEAAKRHDALAAKDVKICSLSCNDSDSHRAWMEDIRAVTGADINFPMIADPNRKYAAMLGVLDRTNVTVELAIC